MSSIFFFQAEDGIRDDLVTGVQTCALPIQAEDGIRDDLVTGVQTCALPISSHQIISYAVFCLEIGRAHVSTQFTRSPRTPSSACTTSSAIWNSKSAQSGVRYRVVAETAHV